MSTEPDTALVELVEALERRETTGKGHSRAVARWAVTLAREVKLHSDHIAVIEKAGLLHDIGKIEVPSYVLNKPARLTAVEFESIKQHPLIGARIARALPSCRDAAVAIAHHHERWDGHGYPHGKRGRDIPTEGRILAVAEAFAAMTQESPFRSALPVARAIERLKWAAHAHLDPDLVEAFLAALERTVPQNVYDMHLTTSLEEYITHEVDALRRAFIGILQQLLWGFEQLVGTELSTEFIQHLNTYFAREQLPVAIEGGRVIDHTSWHAGLDELVATYRAGFRVVITALGKLLGQSYVYQWLRAILDSMPQELCQICYAYRLCPIDYTEVACA